MYNEILPFAFVLLSSSLSRSYIIQYEYDEKNCTIFKTTVTSIVQCRIENEEFRRFLCPSSLTKLRVKFLLQRMKNLTLPNDFIVSTSKTDDFLVRPYLNHFDSFIEIDTTTNPSLKQLTILNDTFGNIVFSTIYFNLIDCGQPILKIESHAFRHLDENQIFVTYQNRSISVTLDEYLNVHCIVDEKIFYRIDLKNFQNSLIKSDRPLLSSKSSISIRLIVNGILLVLLLLLSFLLFLHIERQTKFDNENQLLSSNTKLSPVDTTESRTSSSSSVSELTTTVMSSIG